MQRLDYWLNKLFYDLHTDRQLQAEYRADRQAILARYPLDPAALAALAADDVGALARHTNPFLMRYYFILAGMTEAVFLAKLRASVPETAHG